MTIKILSNEQLLEHRLATLEELVNSLERKVESLERQLKETTPEPDFDDSEFFNDPGHIQ